MHRHTQQIKHLMCKEPGGKRMGGAFEGLKEVQKATACRARRRAGCDDTVEQELSKDSHRDLQQLRKTVWRFLKKIKNRTTIPSSDPHLNIQPK